MAFSATFVKKFTVGGLVFERQTWNSATATSGTITCDTTVQPEITEIVLAIPDNNADHAMYLALDAGANIAKISGMTSGDTGGIWLVGVAR